MTFLKYSAVPLPYINLLILLKCDGFWLRLFGWISFSRYKLEKISKNYVKLSAYIQIGISAIDLLTASVLSAPASLAIAKLIFPEVQKSKFSGSTPKTVEKGDAVNIVDAAAKGKFAIRNINSKNITQSHIFNVFKYCQVPLKVFHWSPM